MQWSNWYKVNIGSGNGLVRSHYLNLHCHMSPWGLGRVLLWPRSTMSYVTMRAGASTTLTQIYNVICHHEGWGEYYFDPDLQCHMSPWGLGRVLLWPRSTMSNVTMRAGASTTLTQIYNVICHHEGWGEYYSDPDLQCHMSPWGLGRVLLWPRSTTSYVTIRAGASTTRLLVLPKMINMNILKALDSNTTWVLIFQYSYSYVQYSPLPWSPLGHNELTLGKWQFCPCFLWLDVLVFMRHLH